MQVGSLVELVEDFKDCIPSYVTIPKKGIIYTVRSCVKRQQSEVFITLEEIVNALASNGLEFRFFSERFRELQPPMSVSELVENCQHFVNVERNFKFDPLKPF